MNLNVDRKKLVIIGLDGATYQIIENLISKNKLTFFKNLIQKGIHGKIKSTIPVNGASSWASFFAGKNPGRHNIYDYLSYKNSPASPIIINKNSIKAPMLWDIANKHDLKTFFFNIPILAEPVPVNGVMVTGFLTPQEKCYAYPESVYEELEKLDHVFDCGVNGHLKPNVYFKMMLNIFKKQMEFFSRKIQTTDWDLVFATFNLLERIQRVFWDDDSKIEEAYSIIDSELHAISERLEKSCHLIVLSNYGYSSVNRKFFVNEWLWERKFLQRNISTQKTMITDVDEIIFNHKNGHVPFITEILTKSGFTKSNIRSILPTDISELLKTAVPKAIKKMFHREYLDINWKKTQAYFVSENLQGININTKGREPNGIVNPGDDYEKLIDKIISELYHLKDPFSLENVVDDVFRKEELFCGDCLDEAPDIILVPFQNKYALDPNKRNSRLSIGPTNDDNPIKAQRNREGTLFLSGPNIKQGVKIHGITIYDLLPTILSLLNIDYNDDFDGKILHKIFENAAGSNYYQSPNFIPEEDLFPFIPDNLFKKNAESDSHHF